MNRNVSYATTLLGAVLGICVLLGSISPQPAFADGDNDYPKFEEVTKGMEVIDGFFTLYHDKKTDRLLARIPAGMLNTKFLLAMSIFKGEEFAGYQWGHSGVYFEKIGKQLVLVSADPRYKKSNGSAISDAIERTYPDSIAGATGIVTLAGQDPLIDLGGFMKSSFSGVNYIYGGSVDSELSRYARIRNFPQNTLIHVDTVVSTHPGGGGKKVGVAFSLSQLPENTGYVPRKADPRIGYFVSAVKDWTTPYEEDTLFDRYIQRWHLRKAEPNRAVSDVLPQDQIVFYIEKTVPVQYRSYVRDGILEWNKAFEAAGLRNVMVVRQQTDTKYADIDPEDVRYNFIRWIVTGTPFAMAPFRVDPFTGRILDSDIVFDDSYIRVWEQEFDVYGPQASSAHTEIEFEEFARHNPEWVESSPGLASLQSPADDPARLFYEARKQLWGPTEGCSHCEIGKGAARNLAMASMLCAKAGKGPLPERFIGEAIRDTVTHEVGHALGLRHNFKASSWLTLDKIQSISADSIEPLVASVMDYTPYNFEVVDGKPGHFATPTIGPYDYWAIEYGYKHFSPSKEEGAPQSEDEMLKQIAGRCAEPGLDYSTDEDTSIRNPDPFTNRWDLGKDPLDFARSQMQRSQDLWKDGLDWAVEDGESYSKARKTFGMLLGNYVFGARMAARMVGGQDVRRDRKGDAGNRLPIEIIPAAKQREALEFLKGTVFSDEAFQFSPDLLGKLAPGRWGHWDSDDFHSQVVYDIHDRVGAIRSLILFQMLNPFSVNRIYDAELKIPEGEDAFTVAELLGELTAIAWSELGNLDGRRDYSNRKPMISSFRRSFQREHLRQLTRIVLSRPGGGYQADVHALARLELDGLAHLIDGCLEKGEGRLDSYTRAHLADSRRRIRAALEAEFVAR